MRRFTKRSSGLASRIRISLKGFKSFPDRTRLEFSPGVSVIVLTLVQELDAQERQMVFAVQFDAPPITWAPLIGDFLHNARSAVDHLFWELIRRRNYGHEPPEGTRATFPIFPNTGRFWRKRKEGGWTGLSGASALWQVPGDARRLILEVQPYKDGNRAKDHPLWLLHSLSNTDSTRPSTM